MAPLVGGGGGGEAAPPPDQLTNSQTSHHQTADFIHNMFRPHMFCPTISKPTRITNYSATLIDNIITNIHEYPIKSGILYNHIADHFPIFNIYKLGWQNTKKYKSKKTYFKNKFAIFKNDCRKTWSTINEVLKSKNKKISFYNL